MERTYQTTGYALIGFSIDLQVVPQPEAPNNRITASIAAARWITLLLFSFPFALAIAQAQLSIRV